MFYSNIALAGAALATLAAAQSSVYNIDPNSVNYTLRQSWCRSQQSICPQACGGAGANPNGCDPNTLNWNCTCIDGAKPNISAIPATVPWWECTTYVDQCVAAHPNDLYGITNCRNIDCGNATVNAVAGSSSSAAPASSSSAASSAAAGAGSSSAAASTSGSPASTAAASGSTSASAAKSSSTSAANAALDFGRSYGTGAVAVGLLALFGIAL